MVLGHPGWSSVIEKKIAQFETKQDRVIYPDIPLNAVFR